MAIARETEDIARELVHHQHEHPPARDVNREIDRREGRGEQVANDFARLVGSWTFVIVQVGLAVVWLLLNAFGLLRRWDPYPFGLLNLVFSAEAALAVSLMLMAFNRIHARDRLRAQSLFEQEVKNEEELRAIMAHLEAQDDMILQVLARLDREDRELRRLTRVMGPEREAM